MKKYLSLIAAAALVIAGTSCTKDNDAASKSKGIIDPVNPQEKVLSLEEQGQRILDASEKLTKSIAPSDFDGIKGVIEGLGTFDFDEYPQEGSDKSLLSDFISKLVSSTKEGNVEKNLMGLNNAGGKYSFKNKKATFTPMDNTIIIELEDMYSLTGEYTSETVDVVLKEQYVNGELATINILKLPKEAKIAFKVKGKDFAVLNYYIKANLHSSIDMFDSAQDNIELNAELSILGYKLSIKDLSLVNKNANAEIILSKNDQKLVAVKASAKDLLFKEFDFAGIGSVNALVDILGMVQIEASTDKIMDLIQNLGALENTFTQAEAELLARGINNAVSANLYYSTQTIQASLVFQPVEVAQGAWSLTPALSIDGKIHDLSEMSGLFEQVSGIFVRWFGEMKAEFKGFFTSEVTVEERPV